MSDFAVWEERFVRRYVLKPKRKRYLTLLRGGKTRRKILDRLNHILDYDENKAKTLSAAEREPEALIEFLRRRGVGDNGYVMAFQNDADGTALPLPQALDTVLNTPWGAVLICPPTPIALYKEEDIGRLVLLDEKVEGA